MPKVDKIPCPTPGCGEQLPIKAGKKGKPYVDCKTCGFRGFALKEKSIRAFSGDGIEPPAPGGKEPRQPAGGKEGKNEWDW